MDSEKEELIKFKEKYQARNKYINNYMQNKYDRVVLLLPKGYKDKLSGAAKSQSFKSVNEFMKMVIDNYFDNQEGTQGTPDSNENFYDGEPLPFEQFQNGKTRRKNQGIKFQNINRIQ